EAMEETNDFCPKCERTAVEFPPRNPCFHFRLIAAVYFCSLLPLDYLLGMIYYSIVLFVVYGRRRISIGDYCKCFNAKSLLLTLLDGASAFVTVLYATVSRKFLLLVADELTKAVLALSPLPFFCSLPLSPTPFAMWSSSLAAVAAATLLLALPLTASLSPSSSSPSSSIDCSSLSDGFFSNGCSSHFIACSGGRAIPMECPADLVYDQTRQQCEYPGNVVACGGEAPEEGSGAIEEGSGSEGSGETDGSGVEGSGVEGSGTEGSGEIEDISGMCEERPDGYYRLAACGESFLGCSGGVAWRMACPASLKYDEKNQICDYPGNVEGCPDAEEGSGEIEGSGTEGSGTEGSGTEGSGTEGSGTEGSGTEGSGTSDVTLEEIEEEQIDTEGIR
ncbi:hypothetical protein PENTCL1PPCAC_27803, partial [Pristionchus entomophagus]